MDPETEVQIDLHKGKLVNIATKIKSIVEQGRLISTDPSQLFMFKGMYKELKPFFDSFNSIWDKIVELVACKGGSAIFPSKSDKATQQAVERYYFEACAIYEDHMNPTPTRRDTSVSLQVPAAHSAVFNESHSVRARLPQINLPHFSGNPNEWPLFRDTYISLIHAETSLSNIEKYLFLVSCLSGPARSLISNVPLTEENYNQAWKLLNDHYNNKRKLANTYLKQILEFKPLTGKPTPSSLKTIIMSVVEFMDSFRNLSIPKPEDFIMAYLILRCLDPVTRSLFEKKFADIEFPTYNDVISFIKSEWKSMDLYYSESEQPSTSSQNISPTLRHHFKNFPRKSLFTGNSNKEKGNKAEKHQPTHKKPGQHTNIPSSSCPVCKCQHTLYQCQQFRNASAAKKLLLLKDWPGCTNCLSGKHPTIACTSLRRCTICNEGHHTWLHQQRAQPLPALHSERDNDGIALGSISGEGEVLLGTAVVQARNSRGEFIDIRVVTDSGSQMSFMTMECARKLGILVQPCDQRIAGIGQINLTAPLGKIKCTLRSSIASLSLKKLSVDAVVVPKITGNLPQMTVSKTTRDLFEGYALADPNYWNPGQVEFLLGGDLFYDILTGQPIVVDKDMPRLIPTIFGFMVAGPLSLQPRSQECSSFLVQSNDELNDIMHKFWDVEEVTAVRVVSEEDEYCERHFKETHYRLDSGRYVISLPVKESIQSLQDTRNHAFKRLMNLEARLAKNPDMRKAYNEFMKDYEELGHMKLVPSGTSAYTLPHHSVVKVQGGHIKHRTVFDASCKSLTGSLNDHLYIGPKLQHDIRDILTNFRSHNVVFTADIVKMYRQIQVAPQDRKYQHILWRFHPSDELKEYELCTVTYGESSAPFSALRTIVQLVQDEGSQYPHASRALLEDIYVDDVATGAPSVEEALTLQSELIQLLGKGCFELSKWASNRLELLEPLKEADCQFNAVRLSSDEEPKIKLLGMLWIPKGDIFTYEVSSPSWHPSKRAVLSAIARIYDPLGFLSPIVFYAKTILQSLWISKCGWDERPPLIICQKWFNFLNQLTSLPEIKIPRCFVYPNTKATKLVGFSDASEKGYSAVIYLVTWTSLGCHINLIKAKTKLAPIKVMTIPRLELSGALLLSQLFKSSEHLMKNIQIKTAKFFTDSEVVLGWLSTSSQRLNAFVAHRVVRILENTDVTQWHYVKSEENPADCSSRGILPSELVEHPLWWTGPHWLTFPEDQWPSHTIRVKDLPEMKRDPMTSLGVAKFTENSFIKWMERFSSYTRLLHSVCYILRFVNICQGRKVTRAPFSLPELRQANKTCIRLTQAHYRIDDKVLKTLNPFSDADGILRVGGRLRHSSVLSFDAKHPIILSEKSHLARLLIDYHHRTFLHIGPTALQAMLLSKYWIISARGMIRKRIFECIKCFKERQKPRAPLMGDLPSFRLATGQVFTHVGVDFGGPFLIRESSRRKALLGKSYLALFICMSTKAIHLEVVSRCTTDAFLAALDRFISRRRKPSNMYSDCGTNFVGAANKLREIVLWQRSLEVQKEISNVAAHRDMEWSFSPASAPHFGGIWEAGIKSAKTILNRVAGDTPLTFEELATLFCQVEGILNSRPLTPVTSDPSSLECLTPGHFLIGRPITSAPEEDFVEQKISPLKRWDLIKQRAQHFWVRWKKEYLNHLQQRRKWTVQQNNLQVGELVIMKEPNSTQRRWPLARVQVLHPGDDGVVRVATIRTSSGLYKRPLVKLVPLHPANYPS